VLSSFIQVTSSKLNIRRESTGIRIKEKKNSQRIILGLISVLYRDTKTPKTLESMYYRGVVDAMLYI